MLYIKHKAFIARKQCLQLCYLYHGQIMQQSLLVHNNKNIYAEYILQKLLIIRTKS